MIFCYSRTKFEAVGIGVVRMPKRCLSLIIFALLSLRVYAQQPTQNHFDGKTWWDHVKVLADDKMEGRDTGSPGLRRAQAYVVEQLKKLGVEPAGVNGYYQSVGFVSRQIMEKESSVALVRDGQAHPLALGDDVHLSTRVDLASSVEAPLVFVGYGLSIPEENYDDLAGLDLKGKVVVYITGSPAGLRTEVASHHQSSAERWKALRAAGAIGVLYIPNPASMDIPWSRMSLARLRPSMALADPQFDDTAGEQLAVTVNPAKAEQLFEGSGHSFSELAELAKERKPLPRFPLKVSVKAKAKVEKKNVESANVVGRLPGSDPQLKNEYVVLTAHLDHLGIGEPINGDRIYNGAMDNAAGCAALLDIAASLHKSQEKLKRSVLFIFLTGEEKGLLGSKYFAAKPTVDAKSIVADLNIDEFLPIVPLKVVTVFGLAESDVGDTVRQVAEAQGIKVQPDPEPLRNLFIRSDQYNFVRHGIPAVAVDVGFVPGSPEQKIFDEWEKQRYHAPSDDLNQPVDLATAAGYEEIMRGVTLAIANADHRPQWKPDSFFRRFAAPAGQ